MPPSSRTLPSIRDAFDAFCMECAPKGDDYEGAMRMVYRVIGHLEDTPAPVSENAPTSDAKDAALWRDLILLHPMDMMMVFSGAEKNAVLLEKLAFFIESKRKSVERGGSAAAQDSSSVSGANQQRDKGDRTPHGR